MIDWTNMLRADVPWKIAYPEVARVVRAWLQAHPLAEGGTLSSHELVEALFPEALAKGDGILARRRLYKALMALATRQLADCASRGPLQSLYGESKAGPKIRPWRWHQPTSFNPEHIRRCSKCGQEIF